MIALDVVKKFGFLYQRIGGLLPWRLVEKIKVVSFALMSPTVITGGIYAYGESFKSFFMSKSAFKEIDVLKEGLDSRSLKLLEILLWRILNFPEYDIPMHLIQIPKEVFTREELDDEIRWFAYQKKCFRLWKFDDFYTAPTFYYHNGLKNISNKFLNYIKGKDFLDLGAYAGDSVLVFQEYGPRKVIAFDVSRLNAEKFWKTMFQNKIPKERVELIIAGVSDSCGKLKINDSGLDDTSLLLHGETEVDTITIDNFIKQRKQSLNVGFIKMDIEGFGLQAIHGMVETIKQYRPVLALAVYHNPSEFFRIKPFIASLDINYRFAIRKFSHAALTGETYLMAWPMELGDYGESFSITGV